ncbi:MAG: hypothetical protein COT18_08655 [Elusimicrobia bacterium CG08_land_8_20_14_0_20_59_10]|nr:MAG: hypothetical protein COT18_08655 [Elusimicrobia bacterium CG08_land_8_20_14_0_20_59_10]
MIRKANPEKKDFESQQTHARAIALRVCQEAELTVMRKRKAYHRKRSIKMDTIENAFAESLAKLPKHIPFYSENDIRFWLLHEFINSTGLFHGLRLVTEYPVKPKSRAKYDIALLTRGNSLFLAAEVKYYYDSFNLKSFKADLQRLQGSSAEYKYFICAIRKDHHQIALGKIASIATGEVQVFKFPTPRWTPTPLS